MSSIVNTGLFSLLSFLQNDAAASPAEALFDALYFFDVGDGRAIDESLQLTA